MRGGRPKTLIKLLAAQVNRFLLFHAVIFFFFLKIYLGLNFFSNSQKIDKSTEAAKNFYMGAFENPFFIYKDFIKIREEQFGLLT